jgi:large subunit ribosomal protein L1
MATTANKGTPHLSKRMKVVRGKIDHVKSYPIDEALKLVKETATAKFDESVDVAVNLGVEAQKSNQTVHGSVEWQTGTRKKVRVAVFAQGDKAKIATEAGADIVGFDDLAAKVKEGFMDFDVVIATPDAMKVVGQLGQILGPRGLMPNPKVGTVSADVGTAVRNAKAGQVQYRTDKAGIIQCTIARVVYARSAQNESDGADRGAEQIETAGHQGDLSEKDQSLDTMVQGGSTSVFGQQQTHVSEARQETNLRERRTGEAGLDLPIPFRRGGAPSKTAGAKA